MIKAILFDMDGVIVDSEPIYMQNMYEFVQFHGVDVSLNDIYKVIGTTMETTWEMLGAYFEPKLSAKETETLYRQTPQKMVFNYKDAKMPHLYFLLDYLKENKIKIALASASPKATIEQVLETLEIKDYFDFYISGEEVENSKPSPDVYLALLDKLNLNADEVIVIEDSTLGIRAGKSAGAKVIGIKDNRFGLDQSEVDFLANDLMEVYNLIHKMKKEA